METKQKQQNIGLIVAFYVHMNHAQPTDVHVFLCL